MTVYIISTNYGPTSGVFLVNFSLTGDGARESQELMDQLADDMDELMRLMQEGDSSEDPNHFQISGSTIQYPNGC